MHHEHFRKIDILQEIKQNNENELQKIEDKIKRTKSKKISAWKSLRDELHNNTNSTTDVQTRTSSIKEQNIDIMEDGNCFFRCISKYQFDTKERHEDIRQ